MEPNTMFTLFCAFLCINSIVSVPIFQDSLLDQNSCSKQFCNENEFFKTRFSLGKTFVYNLETKTSFQAFTGQQSEVTVQARVEISAHNPCELSMQLRAVRLIGLLDSSIDQSQQTINTLISDLEKNPIQFAFSDGKITDFCPDVEDNEFALNLKKSILSALQISAQNLEKRSVVLEKDFLGNCQTVYEPISQRQFDYVIRKSKILNQCSDRQQTQIGFFPNSYALNEFIGRTTYPLLNTSYECEQTLDKDIIVAVTCQERQSLFNTLQVSSQLSLVFEKQIQGLRASKVQQMARPRHQLLMTSHYDAVAHSQIDQSQLITQLRQICSQLENDAVQELTSSWPQLVSSIAQLNDQSKVQSVYDSIPNICSQNSQKLRDLYIDALVSSASEGAVQLLVSLYTQQSITPTRASYLFSLLAFAARPSPRAVQYVLPLLGSSETPEGVLLGVSSLLYNLRQQSLLSAQQRQQSVQQLLQQLKQSNENVRQTVLLRALENIGFESSADAVNTVYELTQNQRTRDGVRVTALQALRLNLNDRTANQLIDRVFSDRSNSVEIRLNAYKSVVLSGKVTTGQLNTIRQIVQSERNPQLTSYVVSHQNNLRQTNDPFKQQLLPSDAPDFGQPSSQQWSLIGQLSNNYEFSYLIPGQSVGVVLESDVIVEKQQKVWNSLTLNASVPVLGKDLQVFELNVRQKGLNGVLEQLLRDLEISFQTLPSFERISQQIQQLVQNLYTNDVFFEINLKIDGKTVLFLNSDRVRQQWGQILSDLASILGNHGNSQRIERMFAFQPINTRLIFPQQNGFPLELSFNQTFLSGISAQFRKDSESLETSLNPYFSLKSELSFGFKVKNEIKSQTFVSELSSNPLNIDFKTEFRNERNFDLKIDFQPKQQKQSLIKFQTNFRQNGGRNTRANNNNREKTIVSKHFGIFAEMEKNPSFFGENYFEIYLQKSDKSLKSFEISFEIPAKNAREMSVWRARVASPGSGSDREIQVEIQVLTPLRGKQELRVRVLSPWIRYTAVTSFNNEERERALHLSLEVNDRKVGVIDVGVDSASRGMKREYRPRVRIESDWLSSRPIELQGSVSVSKGKKNQISVQLEGNDKQLIKGNIVREIDSWSKFRLSSDLTLSLPSLELRLISLTDKAVKHLSTDVSLEYQYRSGRRESLKMSGKAQNLTQSSLTKVSLFGELTSTQFPQKNFHFAYNLLKKPYEHLENELTVTWAQQLRDKLHVLQVSKYSGEGSRDGAHQVENSVVIEVTPLHVNYEVKSLVVMETKHNAKYSLDLSGKDRQGSSRQNDVKVKVNYRQVQQSPLHLTMDAQLKTQQREWQYRDELREMARNEFEGKTAVKWGPQESESAHLDYNYRVKSGRDQFHHEMDAQLRTPFEWMQHKMAFSHSGLLKMSANEFELRSKLNSQNQQLYDLNTLLSKLKQSHVHITANGVEGRVSVSPYAVPQLASVSVTSESIQHKTDAELVPNQSLSVRSETKQWEKPLFSVDSHLSRNRPSRIVINSEPFEGRVDWDSDADQQTAALDVQSKRGQQWSHSSQYKSEPNRRSVSLKSNTVVNGNQVLNIDGNLAKRGKSYLTVEIPETYVRVEGNGGKRTGNLEVKTRDSSHKTSVEWLPNEKKVNSQTLFNRRQLFGLNYANAHALHTLEVQTPDHWSEVSGQYSSGQPFAKIHLKAKPTHYEHVTRVQTEPESVLIESKTEKSGQKLYDLNALLSRDSESNIRIVGNERSARLTANPFGSRKSAKFEYNAGDLDHVTEVEANDQSEVRVQSNTKQNQNRLWNLSLNRAISSGKVSANIPAFDSDLEYNTDNSANNAYSGKLQFQGKEGVYQPWKHVTEVELSRQRSGLQSLTQRNGENVFSLDGQSDDVTQRVGVKVGANENSVSSTVRTSVVKNGNQKQLNFGLKTRDINHVTDIGFDSNSLELKSRTDNNRGQQYNKIDSKLTSNKGQKSHFSIQSQSANANLEFEPEISRGKIDLNLELKPGQVFSHYSEVKTNPENGVEFESKTVNSGKNVLSVNSELNGLQGNNRLAVNCLGNNQFSGEINPNSGKLSIESGELSHNTNYNLLNGFAFDSKTQRNNALLAHVSGRVSNNGVHALNVETSDFQNENSLDLNERRIESSLRSKLRNNGRHLKMALHVPNNGFHSDIYFDFEKNPEQRLKIDLNFKELGKKGLFASNSGEKNFEMDFNINYAQNVWQTLLQMNTNDVLSGPHELSVNYLPKEKTEKESIFMFFKHFIKNKNQMNCNFEAKEGNVLRYKTDFSLKKNSDGFECNFQSIAPKNPEMEYKLFAKQRKSGNEYSIEARADQQLSRKMDFKLNLLKESWSAMKGNVFVDIPELEINGQQYDLEFKRGQKEWELFAKNGKQFSFLSQMNHNYNKSVVMEIASNIEAVPSLHFKANYSPNGEISLKLLKDQFQQWIDFWLNFSKISAKDVEINGKLESKFFPNSEISLKWLNNHNSIESNSELKWNEQKLFSHVMSAQKRDNVWTGSGRVDYRGEELIDLLLESNSGRNSLQYLLKTKAKDYKPLSFEFTKNDSNKQNPKTFLKFCQNLGSNQEKCSEVSFETKKLSENKSFFPFNKLYMHLKKAETEVLFDVSFWETLKASSVDSQNSLLSVSTAKAIEKIRNSFLLQINGHNIGFESLTTLRESNGFDSLFRIMFANNREMQFRLDTNGRQRGSLFGGVSSQTTVVKTDFRSDVRDARPLFTSTTEIKEDKNAMSVKFVVKSDKFENNNNEKSIQWFYRKSQNENSFESKLSLDVSREPNNALFFETKFDFNENQNNNKTLSLNVYTRDRRRVDFESVSHVSDNGFGIFWKNLNKNGVKSENYVFLRFLSNNRFEVIARDSNGEKRISGQYLERNEGKKNEISYEIKIFGEKVLSEKSFKIVLNENSLRFESNERVLEISFNAEKDLFELFINSLDKNLGQKVKQFSLELNAKQSQSLSIRLHWNPLLWQNVRQVIDNTENYSVFENGYGSAHMQEWEHKMALITGQLRDDLFIPFSELFFDQFSDIFQEFFQNFKPLNLFLQKMSELSSYFGQQFNEYVVQQMAPPIYATMHYIQSSYSGVLKSARQQCKRYEGCYRMQYTLNNYGFETFVQYLLEKSQQFVSQSHRLVVNSWGHFYINTLLPQLQSFLPQFVFQYFARIQQSIEYSFESLLNSNQELKQFSEHLTEIFEQILKQNSQTIEWSRVRHSLQQLWTLIVNNVSALNTSARIIQWSPESGDVTLEINANRIESARKLRSVYNKTEMTSNGKGSEGKIPEMKSFVESLEKKFISMKKSMF